MVNSGVPTRVATTNVYLCSNVPAGFSILHATFLGWSHEPAWYINLPYAFAWSVMLYFSWRNSSISILQGFGVCGFLSWHTACHVFRITHTAQAWQSRCPHGRTCLCIQPLYPRAKRFSRFISTRGYIRTITSVNHNACEYNNRNRIARGHMPFRIPNSSLFF